MKTNLDLTADVIDMRDVTDRADELEAEALELLALDTDDEPLDNIPALEELDDAQKAVLLDAGILEEMVLIRDLLEELRGAGGGDKQWRGDWYPGTLIRDSYFETAMDELLEDIGDLPKDLPGYLTITVNYDALRMDYSSVEIDGTEYWWR